MSDRICSPDTHSHLPDDWRTLLRADRARLAGLAEARGIPVSRLSPSALCVLLYRLSHRLHTGGHRLAARALWRINMMLTGADISPASRFGPGLVVLHTVAATLYGHAGRNLTVEGHGGLGGGLDMADIGAGPGLPLLGDDVHLARGAAVLGPVRVGDRVRVGPGCTVVRDVGDDTELAPHALRTRRAAAPRLQA